MATEIRTGRVKNIAALVGKLPASEQIELEKQLKLLLLMIAAERFDSVKPKGKLTMKEIVEEVRKVRKARYARRY